MKNRDDALVRKILEYCNESEEAIRMCGEDIDLLKKNSIFRNAACMPILQIGELCKLISDEMRESISDVDWSGWCGVRDILAHQYTNLDYNKTWTILRTDMPELKEKLLLLSREIDRASIDRIQSVMNDNGLDNPTPEEIYHRIVDGTGVSLNAFSDEKIVEFINNYSSDI